MKVNRKDFKSQERLLQDLTISSTIYWNVVINVIINNCLYKQKYIKYTNHFEHRYNYYYKVYDLNFLAQELKMETQTKRNSLRQARLKALAAD